MECSAPARLRRSGASFGGPRTPPVANQGTAETASVVWCEFAEGDELERGEFTQNRKGFAFDIARGAEASPNAREIRVVIARMRDEFPSAGANPIEKPVQIHCFECTGAGYAECAAGGSEAFFGNDAVPGGLKAAENADLRSANEAASGRCANGPLRLEWIAN